MRQRPVRLLGDVYMLAVSPNKLLFRKKTPKHALLGQLIVILARQLFGMFLIINLTPTTTGPIHMREEVDKTFLGVDVRRTLLATFTLIRQGCFRQLSASAVRRIERKQTALGELTKLLPV